MSDSMIFFDSPAYDQLLKELQAGKTEPREWFELRLQAEKIALSPGFEQLLSLNTNTIDEYPHQIDAVLTALRRMRGRALLADEVGLGKTIEAGIILKELIMRGLARNILILVPAPLTQQWQEEMETKFGEEFVVNTSLDGWTENNRIIASIDLAKRPDHSQKILERSWDMLIVDEAHRLRNRSSVAWKFVNSVKRKYMLLLTATPVHNELAELYALVTLLKPGLLKTYRAFKDRYVNYNNPLKPINGAELKGLLSEVMIRNRRSSVSVKFPPRTAYTYRVKLSKAEYELYTATSQFIRNTSPSGTELMMLSLMQREVCSSASSLLGTLDKLTSAPECSDERKQRFSQLSDLARAVPAVSKVDAACKIVNEANDKVIVFTEFSASQKLISDALRANGVSVVEFHGGLTPAEKNAAIQSFKNDVQVLVSTESGGEGRNLQFCNVMINYDLPWNPMLVEQRIGRIHRLGQTREVYVFNLCAQNTIEEYILDLLASKIKMFELVVGELDLILGNLETKDTFEDTLRRIWLESKTDSDAKRELTAFADRIVDARNKFAHIKEADVIVSKIFD